MWSGRALGAGATIAVAACLTACGAATAPTVSRPVTTVGIVIEDFKIDAGATRIAAGRVSFLVANNGPSTHEFNVDRTGLPADGLPIDSSGLQIDQGAPSLQRMGSVESLEAGATRRLTLDLTAGHYVMYCDLPGHYMSGMRVALDVY